MNIEILTDDYHAESIFDEEEFKIDYNDLLEDDVVENKEVHMSPMKRSIEKNNLPEAVSLSLPMDNSKLENLCLPVNNSKLELKPNDTNIVANNLFQVTKYLRNNETKQKPNHDIFELNDDLFFGKKLNNDKIEKLINELKDKDENLELDDQLRTRVFKGRFSKSSGIQHSEHLDFELSSYLENNNDDLGISFTGRNHENKENLSPYPDPLKTNKSKNSIKKSSKVYFKSPQRNGIVNKSQIPILKPLSNLTNVDLRKSYGESFTVKPDIRSPRRICSPRYSKNLTPAKPCIKYRNQHHNIFIVDSLTGHVNDATQFGTELNASNCEGFPLPEDINEIVQIPTNENSTAKKGKRPKAKMAIIKAFRNKYFSDHQLARTNKRMGFYTKSEFDNYKSGLIHESNSNQVEVVSQSMPSIDSSPVSLPNTASEESSGLATRKVRWALELEW